MTLREEYLWCFEVEKYGKYVMKKEENDREQGCNVGSGQMVCSVLVRGERLRFDCQCD